MMDLDSPNPRFSKPPMDTTAAWTSPSWKAGARMLRQPFRSRSIHDKELAINAFAATTSAARFFGERTSGQLP
jgi:hypothetical protein